MSLRFSCVGSGLRTFLFSGDFMIFEKTSINERLRKIRELRNISKEALAEKLNIPLEKYIEFENKGRIPAQILLEISHHLQICNKYLYSEDCIQNNPLCITMTDFKCPHYTFDKAHIIDSFSTNETQTLLKLNFLDEEERSYLLKTIDYLYYKKINSR